MNGLPLIFDILVYFLVNILRYWKGGRDNEKGCILSSGCGICIRFCEG